MDIWQWVLVYAALLALLQVLLYFYMRDGEDGQSIAFSGGGEHGQRNGTVPHQSPYHDLSGNVTDQESAPRDSDEHQSVPDENTLVCPHCGAHNDRDSVYTYCRNCVTQLGI